MKFSCALDPDRSKFTLSSKRGRIVGMIPKELDFYNSGRFTLPLRPIHNSELTPCDTLEQIDLHNNNLIRIMFYSSGRDKVLQNNVDMNQEPRTDTFYSLRRAVSSFWLGYCENPKVGPSEY